MFVPLSGVALCVSTAEPLTAARQLPSPPAVVAEGGSGE